MPSRSRPQRLHLHTTKQSLDHIRPSTLQHLKQLRKENITFHFTTNIPEELKGKSTRERNCCGESRKINTSQVTLTRSNSCMVSHHWKKKHKTRLSRRKQSRQQKLFVQIQTLNPSNGSTRRGNICRKSRVSAAARRHHQTSKQLTGRRLSPRDQDSRFTLTKDNYHRIYEELRAKLLEFIELYLFLNHWDGIVMC